MVTARKFTQPAPTDSSPAFMLKVLHDCVQHPWLWISALWSMNDAKVWWVGAAQHKIIVHVPDKRRVELKTACCWGEVEETGERFTLVNFTWLKTKHLI